MWLLFAVLIVALLVGCLGAFISWRRRLLIKVLHGSELADTARGPVEYARLGAGPVILHLHGGAAGYDQASELSWDLHQDGFAVLTPSRPGYLRTPLATGATPEEAADAMASLLDVLGFEKVCVMGTSGGGPTALQFGLRHPERVWGLVLQSAISQRFVEPSRSTHSLIGRVIFSKSGKWLPDFGAWVVHLLASHWPSLLARMLFNAGEALDRDKARRRRQYVRHQPEQLAFFPRLAASGMPLSVRQTGLWNDLNQYAKLPVYPLERLTCPTLVLHGKADGNVPFAHAEFVARTAPMAELVAIEDCGHFIWVGPAAAQAREKVVAFLHETRHRWQIRQNGGRATSAPFDNKSSECERSFRFSRKSKNVFENRTLPRQHARSLQVPDAGIGLEDLARYMKRTHHCNELRPAHIGQTVTLSGWVHSRRDLGGLIFIDVRDREGRTQTVFDPSDLPKELFEQAAALRSECVISLTGKVRPRPAGTNNLKISTGEIEVAATSLELLNSADVLPFPVDDPEAASKVNEELRLKYRYLDLRRPEMARNLRLRSKVATATRVYMDEQGFLEVETPILFKSTPEGAREFLVPNRRDAGTFYALPQSPQQFKQILMVAGVERYYQLARCFRDEDQRADRQLEFTQIDIEMSFIDREDLYALVEGLLKRIWKTALNIDVPTPFRRLSYQEAINRYGIDKPDTRFGMELADFTDEFRGSSFKVFSGTIVNHGVVKAINAKGLACATQAQTDGMTELAKEFGAKGLAYIKVEGGEWKSPIVKFFSEAEKAALSKKLAIEEGDLILFAADQWLTACEILGRLRLYCAEILKASGKLVVPADRFEFLWVVDFPLVSFDKEQNRWYSSHHPFTAPVAEDIAMLKTDPKKVRGQHYDIVVNGVELGGGSIRIHQPDVQKTVFEDVLQIPPEETKVRFGYMLDAFRYGAPPHGGIALGFDRLNAILCGTPSIRDVIAFPKTAKGVCLMTETPTPVSPRQLRELHIEVKAGKKE